jgi:predicted permease
VLGRLRSLLQALVPGSRLESELDEELRFHLASRADDLERTGLPRAEAERRARVDFGSLASYKEAYREARGLRFLDELRQDLLYTLRSMRRNPGLTAVATATLTLGIGANSLLFTVVESVLLRPLPYSDPDRLVMIYSKGSFGPHEWADGPLAEPDHLELRRLTAFSSVAAFGTSEATLTGTGDPLRLPTGTATASLFPLLGVGPALGRVPEADERGVVVLSDALWRSRFGADPRVLGASIVLEGEPYTIVGVMPAPFNFPAKAQLWTPLELRPDYRANVMYKAIGRLAPGMTRKQALTQVETLLGNIGNTLPPSQRVPGVVVMDLREAMVGDSRTLLLVLLGAVLCVLLIGCANLANLLMARAAARGQEMFVRTSLGAGRARLARQLLTESAALSTIGGGLGLALAYAGLPLFLRGVPKTLLARLDEVRVDGSVVAFTLALSLLTGLLFGLAPALFCLRRNGVGHPLQRAGPRPPRREKRLHEALIVAETGLVLVLLIGAGLLGKSFWRLSNVDPGFRREGLLTLSLWLPDRSYPTPSAKRTFHTRLLEGLQATPELTEASAINLLPFGSAGWRGDFAVEGRKDGPDLMVGKPAVSEGYFRTLGIPLLRGRFFDAHDADGAPRVAIVTETVARHCWPGLDALGKRLSMDQSEGDHWLTVVGVVSDVRQDTLANAPQPMIYVPLRQEWRGFFLASMAFVARARADQASAAAALRRELRVVDPQLPAERIETLGGLLSDSLAEPRFRSRVLAAFGLLALSLSLVGIYGVMAYEVTRRTAEIGIRRALGAEAGDVLWLVVGRTGALVSGGLGLGLLAAFAVTRVLESFLYAVRPLDLATFALVSLGLAGTSLLASALPARQAARVDPAVALRYE